MKLNKKSYVNYMFSFIERVCNEIGPRPGTSQNELKAGQMIEKEYRKFCDVTKAEPFTCRPGGFLGIMDVIPVLQVLATIFYLFFPLISIVLTILMLLCYVLEMNYLREFVDPLFGKRTSANVYGKIKAKSKSKATVIIGAHHDSPVEFPIPIKWRAKAPKFITVIIVVIGIAIVIYVAKIVGQYFNLIYMNWTLPFLGLKLFDFLIVFPIIGVVLAIALKYGLKSNTQTLGANDNLSGVAVTLGVAEYFSKNRPKNVDVWVISHGCEECMRGSKRFVDRHWKELERKNAYTINFDTAGIGRFLIVSEEKMFTAKHSTELCRMLEKSASRLHLKHPAEVHPLPFAGTDSAFYSKKGLKATSVLGLAEDNFPVVWHNREDTPERLDKQNLYDMVRMAVQFVEDLGQIVLERER